MKEAEKADLKERALSAIFMSITNNFLRKITDESSASTAWKKLEEIYSTKIIDQPLTSKEKTLQYKNERRYAH